MSVDELNHQTTYGVLTALQSKERSILLAPSHYLSSFPGKDIRGKLITAFNGIFKIPEDKLEIIKRVIELLHLASLLVDDIEDSSKLRRGVPVAHSIFGVAQTLNCANYMYFQAQSELFKLNSQDGLKVFMDEMLRLHRGQGMDLYWRDSLTCPTEEEYLEMVSNKTGGLFRLALRLIQDESDINLDCTQLVNLLGIIYQIRDDYLNLQGHDYSENKGFGEDITEGKFSYPIIHSIRSAPDDLQLRSILRQKPEDVEVKNYAIQIIDSNGSFEYCRQKLLALNAQASNMLNELDDAQNSAELMGILSISGSCLCLDANHIKR
ncbi:isoprenoid synthase domain-containing protein [Aspergillus ambiguus]|uniref:FPP/GGPP synthase family protein n=1 Tax=Aspergillus ambiguus TaxID=176160 RepID=UPI003CCE4C17